MSGDTNLIRALEGIAILRTDGNMTEHDLDDHGIVKGRTLRSWSSGNVRKIAPQRALKVEQAVLEHVNVPWSEHYYFMTDQIWNIARTGGQQAVIEALRRKLKGIQEDPNWIRQQLSQAEIRPERAQDINPVLYTRGAAIAVKQHFGHYAELMLERYHTQDFPNPEHAKSEDWTTVLVLRQFRRDSETRNDEIDNSMNNWIFKGCEQYGDMTWVRILKFRITEAETTAKWLMCRTVEERINLLNKHEFFKRNEQYRAVVKGNITAARNALAAASATCQRARYAKWHSYLSSYDDAWNDPVRMRAQRQLDEDFDDFIGWWSEKQ